MRKTIAILLVLVMATAMIASCAEPAALPEAPDAQQGEAETAPAQATAPPTAPPPPQAEDEEPEEVTLTWAMWDEHLIPYYAALVEAYREVAPHVTIDLVDLGTAEFETIVQTHLIGGADYDIVKVRNMQAYANMLGAGLLLPLDDKIPNTNLDMTGFGGFTDILRPEDGGLYTLPIRRDHWVIFYNKDIFDAAGIAYPTNEMRTSDFDALVRNLGEATPDGVWGNVYHWWPSIVHLFGVVGRNALTDGVYDWKSPFYEMVKSHQQEGHAPSHVDLTVGNIHYSVPWYNAETAMVNMGTWFIAMQMNAYAEGTSEVSNWGIAAYPVPRGVPFGTSPAGFTGIGIGRNSANAQEAMNFIAFASGPAGAGIMVEVGQMPGMMTDDVIDRIVALDGFPQDETSRNALRPTALVPEMPMHPNAAQVNTLIGTAHTEIMTGNATIEDGIEMMNQQIGRDLLGIG